MIYQSVQYLPFAKRVAPTAYGFQNSDDSNIWNIPGALVIIAHATAVRHSVVLMFFLYTFHLIHYRSNVCKNLETGDAG